MRIDSNAQGAAAHTRLGDETEIAKKQRKAESVAELAAKSVQSSPAYEKAEAMRKEQSAVGRFFSAKA